MIECPPFFRPHKNDLGLTRFTKPLLSTLEQMRAPEKAPETAVILFWERGAA